MLNYVTPFPHILNSNIVLLQIFISYKAELFIDEKNQIIFIHLVVFVINITHYLVQLFSACVHVMCE